MFNAKVIAGLKAVSAGYAQIAEGLEEINFSTPEDIMKAEPFPQVPTGAGSNKKKAEKLIEEVPADEVESTEGGEITAEYLSGMSYNDLKKFAKEIGVSAVGARDDITARILGAVAEQPADEEEAEEVAEAVTEAEAETEEEETEEADEEEEQTTAEKVEEAVADMTDEDIANLLVSVGLSPKGKRQALIAKVVKAVEEGVIDFGDDEESEDVEDAETVEDEESEEDEIEMTEARAEALEVMEEDTRSAFETKDLTREEVEAWLLDSQANTKAQLKKMSDEDLLERYLDLAKNFIDDEGNTVEEGAYEVDGVPFCCGQPLKEVDGKFVCESCGSEYEAE